MRKEEKSEEEEGVMVGFEWLATNTHIYSILYIYIYIVCVCVCVCVYGFKWPGTNMEDACVGVGPRPSRVSRRLRQARLCGTAFSLQLSRSLVRVRAHTHTHLATPFLNSLAP